MCQKMFDKTFSTSYSLCIHLICTNVGWNLLNIHQFRSVKSYQKGQGHLQTTLYTKTRHIRIKVTGLLKYYMYYTYWLFSKIRQFSDFSGAELTEKISLFVVWYVSSLIICILYNKLMLDDQIPSWYSSELHKSSVFRN